MAINHFPWDDGALDVLSRLVGQKTIKTKCNMRVAYEHADASLPTTCPICERRKAEEAHGRAWIEAVLQNRSYSEISTRVTHNESFPSDIAEEIKRRRRENEQLGGMPPGGFSTPYEY